LWILKIRNLLFFLVLTTVNVLPDADRKPNIAVLDFEGIGINDTEARALTNRLRSILGTYPQYQLIERGRMEEILKEQQFQLSGCTSDACAVEIGQLLNAEQMVAGSFGLVGMTYTIDMRLIDVETGKVIATAQYNLKGKIDDVLEYGLKATLDQLLDIKKNQATVRILSNPTTAEITINGIKKGNTPLLLTDLAAGTALQITCAKENYQPRTQEIQLHVGENPPINLRLEYLKGLLIVTGSPAKTQIRLNWRRIGASPLQDSLEVGKYQLTISKPEYHPLKQTIKITNELPVTVNYALKPMAKKAVLKRSLIFPGFGQFYQKYPLKGLAFAASGLALAYLAVDAQVNYSDRKNTWLDTRNIYNHNLTQPELWPQQLDDLKKTFDKMKDLEKRRNIFLGGLGIVWSLNLIDIAL